MPFGGGTWITQNKVLPGAYINVVSAGIASAALSDRGIATICGQSFFIEAAFANR